MAYFNCPEVILLYESETRVRSYHKMHREKNNSIKKGKKKKKNSFDYKIGK